MTEADSIRSNPWFWTPDRAVRGRIRLLCLPFAGSGAGVFMPWAKALPEQIELWGVRLPGRESRWKERPLSSVAAIAPALAAELAPWLSGTPYAVFGYSLGSVVAFELLRELRRRGLTPPRLFIAGGRGAPQLPSRNGLIHTLPDEQFLDAIVRRYQAIPKIVLEDEDLRRIYLPPLRADMTANETYRYVEEPPLDVPIVAVGGLDDHTLAMEDLVAWRAQTNAAFELQMFPGGHFFLQQQPAQLLDALGRRLA